jgi:hypothetical protein
MTDHVFTPADLQSFCSTEKSRPYLMSPWSHGDFTYATNGHILIRVPRLPEIAENPKAPNAEKVLAMTASQSETTPLPSFEIPASKLSACRSCKGRGTEHDCPDCACECPECDGSGQVVEKMSLGLHGAIFNAKYILILKKLPGIRVAGQCSPDGPNRFTCHGGGEGAIMPMRGAPRRHHIEILPTR